MSASIQLLSQTQIQKTTEAVERVLPI